MTTTLTPPGLIEFAGGTPTADVAWAQRCIDEAEPLIDNAIGSWSASVPEEARERCILETAAELFQRRAARGGIVGFDSVGETSPVYAPLDSMRAARRILREYIPVGFA